MRHKNSLKVFLTGAATLVMALSSCSEKETILLETTKATLGEVSETVTATGTLESVNTVDVGTQVTGIIDQIYVDYNSEVKKGQLIAEIEKVLLQSDLESAQKSMEQARLTYEYNKTNYERDKALHDKQLISDYEFDTSYNTYRVSKAAYEKTQAEIQRAKKNLEYAQIYSPMDGIVISRDVEVGQTVVSNMTVANLFTIGDLDNMRVVANVDEADIGQVKVGQKVTFTVDAYSDDTFEGEVTQVRISPTTESNVVTYEVLVSAPNPEHKLIPGLTANLTIYVTQEQNVVTIPVKALHFTPHEYPEAKNLPEFDPASANTEVAEGKSRVWVVSNGKLKPVDITTSANNGLTLAVTSGLKDGDIIAMSYSVGTASEAAAEESSDQETSPFAPQGPKRKK
jgi:HlyD family secretion protein